LCSRVQSDHELERRSATKLVRKVEQVDAYDPSVVHDEDYFKRLQNSASHRFASTHDVMVAFLGLFWPIFDEKRIIFFQINVLASLSAIWPIFGDKMNDIFHGRFWPILTNLRWPKLPIFFKILHVLHTQAVF
jgi:hypothetical protein